MKKFFFYTISSMLLVYCSSDKENEKKIRFFFANKDNFLSTLKDKDILITSKSATIDFGTENRFLFKTNNNNSLQLDTFFIRDTIKFQNHFPNGLSFIESSGFYDSVTKEAKELLDTLRKYNIVAVSSRFKNNGVTLKIYLSSNIAILYVKDYYKLVGEWKKYIDGSKKFDREWYYNTNEFYGD